MTEHKVTAEDQRIIMEEVQHLGQSLRTMQGSFFSLAKVFTDDTQQEEDRKTLEVLKDFGFR